MSALRTAMLAGLLWGCARSQPERLQREPVAAATGSVSAAAAPADRAADSTAQRSAAAAPPRSGAGSSAPPLGIEDCARICAAATQLKCTKSASCVPSCVAMAASAPACTAQLSSFFHCLGSQAADHWECLEDGTGAIREGFCEVEQAAFAACLERNQH